MAEGGQPFPSLLYESTTVLETAAGNTLHFLAHCDDLKVWELHTPMRFRAAVPVLGAYVGKLQRRSGF